MDQTLAWRACCLGQQEGKREARDKSLEMDKVFGIADRAAAAGERPLDRFPFLFFQRRDTVYLFSTFCKEALLQVGDDIPGRWLCRSHLESCIFSNVTLGASKPINVLIHLFSLLSLPVRKLFTGHIRSLRHASSNLVPFNLSAWLSSSLIPSFYLSSRSPATEALVSNRWGTCVGVCRLPSVTLSNRRHPIFEAFD